MKYLLLAAVAAAIGSPAAAAVMNGGFETPAPPANFFTQYAGGSNIGGAWTVSGADVLVLHTGYNEAPAPNLVFNAHSGNAALDITGAGNTSPANGVSQALATTAGLTYALTFWIGNADHSGTGDNRYTLTSTINLAIGGGPALGYANSDITANMVNWKRFDVNFTASGASTLIAFTNGTPGTPGGPDNYAGLDDVSVAQVPEPAALGLLGLGILGIAGARRRRR